MEGGRGGRGGREGRERTNKVLEAGVQTSYVHSSKKKKSKLLDRTKWTRELQNYSGNPIWWEKPERKMRTQVGSHDSRQHL